MGKKYKVKITLYLASMIVLFIFGISIINNKSFNKLPKGFHVASIATKDAQKGSLYGIRSADGTVYWICSQCHWYTCPSVEAHCVIGIDCWWCNETPSGYVCQPGGGYTCALSSYKSQCGMKQAAPCIWDGQSLPICDVGLAYNTTYACLACPKTGGGVDYKNSGCGVANNCS